MCNGFLPWRRSLSHREKNNDMVRISSRTGTLAQTEDLAALIAAGSTAANAAVALRRSIAVDQNSTGSAAIRGLNQARGGILRGALTPSFAGAVAAPCNESWKSGLSALPHSMRTERRLLDADRCGSRMRFFNRGSSAFSSASNFKSTLRFTSLCASARRFLNRIRVSQAKFTSLRRAALLIDRIPVRSGSRHQPSFRP
jgi:hypothetical protein